MADNTNNDMDNTTGNDQPVDQNIYEYLNIDTSETDTIPTSDLTGIMLISPPQTDLQTGTKPKALVWNVNKSQPPPLQGQIRNLHQQALWVQQGQWI